MAGRMLGELELHHGHIRDLLLTSQQDGSEIYCKYFIPCIGYVTNTLVVVSSAVDPPHVTRTAQ